MPPGSSTAIRLILRASRSVERLLWTVGGAKVLHAETHKKIAKRTLTIELLGKITEAGIPLKSVGT
jgi:hypothetical protein